MLRSAVATMLLVSMGGCYAFHELPGDAPAPECTPPPAIDCPDVRAAATCLAGGAVEPGRAFLLPVTFDVTGCCPARACTARVVEETRTLVLTTSLCADEGSCETPRLVTAECDVPPLPEGSWSVEVNGSHAFDLPVTPRDASALCASYGEPYCEPSGRLFTAAYHPDGVCIDVEGGATFLTAQTICWEAFWADGPCLVTLEPDASGGTLQVRPQRFEASCLDHDACSLHEKRCLLPPLSSGSRYAVVIDGVPALSFVAGDAAGTCSD